MAAGIEERHIWWTSPSTALSFCLFEAMCCHPVEAYNTAQSLYGCSVRSDNRLIFFPLFNHSRSTPPTFTNPTHFTMKTCWELIPALGLFCPTDSLIPLNYIKIKNKKISLNVSFPGKCCQMFCPKYFFSVIFLSNSQFVISGLNLFIYYKK